MIQALPPAADIVNASATSTTVGLVSVPGGRWLTADVQLAASVAVAGNSVPTLTFQVPGGTSGAAPAGGSVLARLTLVGLALTTVTESSTVSIHVYGGDNGCTLDFTAGANGSSSCVINGFLL